MQRRPVYRQVTFNGQGKVPLVGIRGCVRVASSKARIKSYEKANLTQTIFLDARHVMTDDRVNLHFDDQPQDRHSDHCCRFIFDILFITNSRSGLSLRTSCTAMLMHKLAPSYRISWQCL